MTEGRKKVYYFKKVKRKP